MFKPLYRLSSDADGRLKLVPTGRRSFRATIIVPRELCVFESLPAQGVAWHELTTFARLQAKRLAPFVETGANAVARGRRLMFWFWDAREVNAAIRDAGQDPAAFRKLAEPLMLPLPSAPGPHTLNCGAGVDLLTVVDQAIVSSVWQASRSVRDRPLPWLATPWGRDRLSARDVGAGAGNRSWPQRVLAAGAALALIVAAGHVAYWRARVDVAGERLAQRSEASTLASGALAQLSVLRRNEKTQSTWLQSYEELGAGLDSSALLKALTPSLQAQGTVVRELEIQGSQLRLLLVAAGGDLNVPSVLSALDGIPGIRSVQLQQNPDLAQASFLMNIDGFRRPAPASVGKELP